MNINYRICSRCIMDTSDPEIDFDCDGVCSHCRRYDIELPKRVYNKFERDKKLDDIVNRIKKRGRRDEYDCIIGVSGGVDSTYVAYITKNLGLNPLAIHFDNGWNSELAVSNIEKTLEILGIDLITYVIDWNQFKDLQLSFLKASTPDGEVPTDHAISALLFKEASKRGIKYIISGMNFSTESIWVRTWSYGHSDWKYIKNIHKLFGTKPLKNYPHFSLIKLFWWTFFKRIQTVSILNYLDYKKEEAMDVLQKELKWKYYGGKHYESVYTRFYQGYVLPVKFGIDKRIGHLSDLIKSGQITRDEALIEIKKEGYTSEMKNLDYEFVLKKLDLGKEQFINIMKLDKRTFLDYPNNYFFVEKLKKVVNLFRKLNLYSK